MRKISLYLTYIIVLLSVQSVSAQFFKSSRQPLDENYFYVDYALFKSEIPEKTARLEIYYQIINAALGFEETNQIFEAEYDLTIDLFKDDKKYDSFKHNQIVRVNDKSKSTSVHDFRTNQVNFMVDEGKYEIIVRLYDPIHFKEKVEKFKIKVNKYDYKYAKVSDVELVQAIAPLSETNSVFDKGDLQLVPSVRHKFRVDDNSSLYFYLELYQGKDETDEVRVETVLRHESKGMMYRDSLTSVFETPIVRQFRELSIEDLRPGKYELIITVRGKRNKKVDTIYKDFEIMWTPQALIKHDYEMLVNQISLIASREDVEFLESKTTYDERVKAYNAFWESQDPTPGTYENEVKTEFYRRVSIANRNFSSLFDNGWRTDRGRIYIMYGEPDQMDDYPVVPDRNPYQEWYYYQNSKYLKFVFVDLNYDGDYKLVYPYDGLFLKPGE